MKDMLSRNIRILGYTMLAGAAYSGVAGAAMLLFPQQVASLLQFPAATDAVGLRLVGLLMMILALFYLMGGMETKGNIVIVAVSVVARLSLGLFGLLYRWLGNGPPGVLIMALLELVFGLGHWYFLWRSDFVLWEVLGRAGRPPKSRIKV